MTMQPDNEIRMPFFSRLRLRLTILFLTIAIVPIALITGIVLSQVETQSRAQTFNQMESISILKGQQIDQWLEGGREQLDLFLVSLQRELASREDWTIPAAAAVQQLADASTSIDDIFFFDPSGKIVFSSDDLLIGCHGIPGSQRMGMRFS